jgi:putative ABC transport system permease protein
MGVRLEHFHSSLAFEPRPALLMLSGAVGVLFLIVCANLASLQLGRAAVRTRELAIRRALGAARTRLVRQLITESLVLSVVGGALGFALVAAARVILLRYASTVVPLFADLRLDRSSCCSTSRCRWRSVLFGVLPALTSSKTDTLAERSASSSRDMSWARSMLVAAEVALSIVLVVGAVLLTRSLARLQQVDPGFNQNNVVAFTLTLPTARYPGNLERLRAYEAIEQQLREQPGVEAVGARSTIALRGFTWTGDTTIEGRSPTDYERDSATSRSRRLLQGDGHSARSPDAWSTNATPSISRASRSSTTPRRAASSAARTRSAGGSPSAARRTTRRGSPWSASSPTRSRMASTRSAGGGLSGIRQACRTR